jgi:hypothetical protein
MYYADTFYGSNIYDLLRYLTPGINVKVTDNGVFDAIDDSNTKILIAREPERIPEEYRNLGELKKFTIANADKTFAFEAIISQAGNNELN